MDDRSMMLVMWRILVDLLKNGTKTVDFIHVITSIAMLDIPPFFSSSLFPRVH